MATLYNKYNAPCKHQFDDKGNLVKKLFASCPGDPIYTYKYKDKKTGELKENTVNMQEKIQSYLTQVDYKKRIELGLGLEVPIYDGNIQDATGLPDNTVDILGLVNAINTLSPEQIANLLQSSIGASTETDTSGQTIAENTTTITETPSTSSTDTTDTTTTGV